ncbi:MAG: flagellar biosynthesis protein FlhA, partial [Oscillospiraceae bacterium]|nr:flagellar biosynthesis protein FlhA [Oscillospiraceae bacterium]
MKIKPSGIVLAAAIMWIVMIMLLPMPTFVMDTLLVFSITIAIIVMLMAISTKDALEFSVFPTIILLVTFFRLSLNLATTRLILSNQGDAGNVIKTFAEFVTGGNFVVGVIIFLIILIIQFMVITKGAERVSEVSARFTLDALPGKQMSIDADLNAGAIDDAQAKIRRDRLQKEIDFHGAMDGASKF